MPTVPQAVIGLVRAAVRGGGARAAGVAGASGPPRARGAAVAQASGRPFGGLRDARRTARRASGAGLVLGVAVAALSQQPLRDAVEEAAVEDAVEDTPTADALGLVDRLSDWHRADEAQRAISALRASGHPEVLWRQGRILYLLALQAMEEKDRKEQLIRDGYASLQRALRADPACGRAHMWLSVLRYERAALDGTVARLRSVDRVREDMERAVALLPEDPLIRTMLGMWFFETAQLPWVERQVVRAACKTVPCRAEGLQRALRWLRDAERLSPGESNLNQLMLGRTLMALGEPESAHSYVQAAAATTPQSQSDAKAQLEARELLQRWKS